jgi:hypothetical protein
MITIVVEAVLYTWIYNHTARSTLAAILFHFVVNAFGELFALTAQAEVYNFVLGILAVAAVVVLWGPKTLTRSPADYDLDVAEDELGDRLEHEVQEYSTVSS